MASQPTPGRLEAFSDGVIAVIITIMVLEFKVPHDSGLHGFLTLLPNFAVYALSFSLTGIYWVNHHHLVDRLQHVDTLILWLNLFLLFCLSLLPFFTNYVVEQHLESFSVSLYLASFMLDGIAYTLLGRAVIRRLRLEGTCDTAREAAEQATEQRKGWISMLIDAVGLGLAILGHPRLALLCVLVVAIQWITPDFSSPPAEAPPSGAPEASIHQRS